MNQKNNEKKFQKKVKEKSPKIPVIRNSIVAFIVGGGICVIGQFIKEFYIQLGFDPEKAGDPTTATIILIAAVLTGLGVFDKIAQFCGAGTAVPVTGFANSMVSAALEFRSEGLVLGVGCKMFSLAGTVIVYGTVTAFFAGIIHALFM
ncbi:stage V sporulation protein AC [Clostridium sp. 'deep sea']|uniref:stage V sporulation protein AC n=1 Tax=Clostridium sp. 'deep sea' TaxID=2779445 RepID=UPI00189655D4|nr:stage V sporulation protein AC [Clostridium sp. 'deep sea']QOR35823.1 stage V sporulation protein AC [Clostridium sp. 'deep sea']